MSYIKTNWIDRAVQYPQRFTRTTDGTYDTLVPAPGTITQSGTPITAAALNNLETQYDQVMAYIQAFGMAAYSVAIGVAAQSMTANTDIQITLIPQGNYYPLDSSWVTSNWTCPQTGVYEITTNIMVNAPADSLSMAKLYLNGLNEQFLYSIYTPVANLVGAGSNTVKKLSSGDTLKFYANNNVAGATIGGNYSRINIKRIG